MVQRLFSSAIVAFALCSAATAATVSVYLESPVAGQSVAPGTQVNWTIKVSVSAGDNVGLALIACDLAQDAGNPAKLDMPPGSAGSIPSNMAVFNRPAGITNPGEGGRPSGYVGVQRGTPGAMNLIQIGGGQDTFGAATPPGTGIAENATVTAGIGQGGTPQVVLSGSFNAPAALGSYTFRLQNVVANVLESIHSPPAFSPVVPATVNLAGAAFSFTVAAPQTGACCVHSACHAGKTQAECTALGGTWQGGGTSCAPSNPCPVCYGDADCSGQINFDDINYFVAALAGAEPGWKSYYASKHGGQPPPCMFANCDANGDTLVDFDDINPFVGKLVNPPTCP